jgi:hypothetical protein
MIKKIIKNKRLFPKQPALYNVSYKHSLIARQKHENYLNKQKIFKKRRLRWLKRRAKYLKKKRQLRLKRSVFHSMASSYHKISLPSIRKANIAFCVKPVNKSKLIPYITLFKNKNNLQTPTKVLNTFVANIEISKNKKVGFNNNKDKFIRKLSYKNILNNAYLESYDANKPIINNKFFINDISASFEAAHAKQLNIATLDFRKIASLNINNKKFMADGKKSNVHINFVSVDKENSQFSQETLSLIKRQYNFERFIFKKPLFRTILKANKWVKNAKRHFKLARKAYVNGRGYLLKIKKSPIQSLADAYTPAFKRIKRKLNKHIAKEHFYNGYYRSIIKNSIINRPMSPILSNRSNKQLDYHDFFRIRFVRTFRKWYLTKRRNNILRRSL